MKPAMKPPARPSREVAFPLRNLLDAGVQDTVPGFARRLNTSQQAVRWVLEHTPTAGVVGEQVVQVAKVYGRLTSAQAAEATVAAALGRKPRLPASKLGARV